MKGKQTTDPEEKALGEPATSPAPPPQPATMLKRALHTGRGTGDLSVTTKARAKGGRGRQPLHPHFTCILRVHMGRVVAKFDEDRDGDPKLEPLYHVGWGLSRHRVDHVASQDHALASSSSHKLRFLSQAVGTYGDSQISTWEGDRALAPTASCAPHPCLSSPLVSCSIPHSHSFYVGNPTNAEWGESQNIPLLPQKVAGITVTPASLATPP